MEKSFKIDLGEKFKNELTVFVEFSCRSQDDCAEIDEITIFDGDDEVSEEKLSKEEFAKVEAEAEKLAYENSYEAYQDYIEGAADDAYDRWKDSQYDN